MGARARALESPFIIGSGVTISHAPLRAASDGVRGGDIVGAAIQIVLPQRGHPCLGLLLTILGIVWLDAWIVLPLELIELRARAKTGA